MEVVEVARTSLNNLRGFVVRGTLQIEGKAFLSSEAFHPRPFGDTL